ncbi:aldo/keto reductase [Aeromicrobium fastidiosum]|uniref:Aldo/keto reductase n=1 Tax=Aeromicrobium fastidiosum TaxID=52699 RepID=A0A641AUS9_9ACTN|nr:aldo/keto reductase [Aeromicrobium fastidiosum]KAA1380608.1 aldo/keto reductase [Aeromicrobium fastidiosum]MBP2390210.1 D-threo-aldose 1-dehydrogenase [Aeromicrobium fastidiosum]
MTPVSTPLSPRPLGASGLVVTGLGVGGSPLGGASAVYGHDTSADEGVATVSRVFDGPITFLDTSNAYSGGDSERRVGEAIDRADGLPVGFVLSTKVDADPSTGVFDGSRVRRSLEESLERLGLDRVPLLHLHDPEEHLAFSDAMGRGGAVEALVAIKREGLVDAIGIAGGRVEEMRRYVQTGAFDVLLTHNRMTLVDRSARPLIEAATERSMGVINAAPFGGGVLARNPRPDDLYAYGLGTASQVDAARRMSQVCERYGVSLAAAALQFAVHAPGVDAVLVGASSPQRVDELVELAGAVIPDELSNQLEDLVPPSSEWIAS